VLYPLVMLLGRVFIDNGQFTLQGLATVLTDRHQLQAFWNSLLLGTLVGLVGTVLGFAFAFTATRCNLPRWIVGLIDIAVLLPLVSPPFTTAIGYIFSFGPRGLITYGVLGIKGVTVYGMTSTLTAESLTYFPIGLPHAAADARGDRLQHRGHGAVARRLALARVPHGHAAAVHAGPRQRLPAALRRFARRLRHAADPRRHQFPVLPTQAYLQITGLFDLRGGAALSLVLLVPALIVFIVQRYWVGRRQYVTVTGKGAGQAPFDSVNRTVRWLLVSFCVAVTLLILCSTHCSCTHRSWWRSAPTTRSRSPTTGSCSPRACARCATR